MQSPESELMSAIFGEEYADDDLHEYCDGISLVDAINDALTAAYINNRTRRIIALRYGFEGGGPHTWQEIASEFRVTRERIRQIEANGMRMLRHPARTRSLKQFIKGNEGI